ncbi:zinc finger protein 184 [Eurytemora carolleeae]|uniref:zinc finger protein 184 n=1 Tax=Eurytemora carolleeae TaxID=1294199 RepID=UPI000C769C20|nr:zinc finger protein 184 [Eurytemora carolleeae]|eukprot:XP_023342321.1 zinc finger protein 184-like [Eurytemora affinis]
MKIDITTKTSDILSLARCWYTEGRHTDISVRCGGEGESVFHCHKLILRDLLIKQLGAEVCVVEDADEIILSEVSKQSFQEYIRIVYGFSETVLSCSLEEKEWVLTMLDIPDMDFQVKIEDDPLAELTIKQEPIIELSENLSFSSVPEKFTKVHTCGFCKKEFRRHDHLNRHMLQHTGEKPFECDQCEKGFTRKDKLKQHVAKHHIDLLSGQLLSQDMKYADEFEEHKMDFQEITMTNDEDEKEGEDHDMKEEDNIEETDETLEEDKKSKKLRPGKKVTCIYCPETFNGIKSRKKHALANHSAEILESCRLLSLRRDGKRKRLKNHTCPEEGCERQFRHTCEVTDHVNVVHNHQKNYICELCSKAFPYRKSLRYHMDLKHNMNKKVESILCPNCGDIFTSKIKLQIHITAKHRIKVQRYQCKFCDFKTHARNVITEHERTHTGEKPEICQWCGKGFNAKKTLRNHERLHTGEKPYKCNHCSSSFAQRTSLNVHFNSHHKGLQPLSSPIKDKDKFNGNYDEQSEQESEDTLSINQMDESRMRLEERRQVSDEPWNSNTLTIKPLNKLQNIGVHESVIVPRYKSDR